MKTTLLIGVGSFIGGAGRYLISKTIQTQILSSFPWGTFTVNVAGCFLIGAVMGWSLKSNLTENWQLFLTTGILGGFTTFSAFSLESIRLIQNGNAMIAIFYIALSVLVGLAATFIGFSLIKIA